MLKSYSVHSVSLVVCNEKFFQILDFRCYVDDVMNRVSLGLTGQDHRTPGPLLEKENILLILQWKLGQNLSLLSL